MQITVRRANAKLRGTHWQPVEHTVHQRETIESVRREVSGDQPDKTIQRRATVQLDAVDLLLAGAGGDYTESWIEDSYRHGRFVGGFIYVKALAAFVHEDEVHWAERAPKQIGPGAIISKAVEIEEGAQIGAYVELERGVKVMANSVIRENTVLRKGALVEEDVVVGAHSYLGQFMHVYSGATVGSMSVIERQVKIATGGGIGRQGQVGLGTYIDANAWLDDSVRVGRYGFVGANANIGEMTTAGDYLHIGDGSFVGAESKFGSFVRVARNLMLMSPTYAADGEFIRESNLTLPFLK